MSSHGASGAVPCGASGCQILSVFSHKWFHSGVRCDPESDGWFWMAQFKGVSQVTVADGRVQAQKCPSSILSKALLSIGSCRTNMRPHKTQSFHVSFLYPKWIESASENCKQVVKWCVSIRFRSVDASANRRVRRPWSALLHQKTWHSPSTPSECQNLRSSFAVSTRWATDDSVFTPLALFGNNWRPLQQRPLLLNFHGMTRLSFHAGASRRKMEKRKRIMCKRTLRGRTSANKHHTWLFVEPQRLIKIGGLVFSVSFESKGSTPSTRHMFDQVQAAKEPLQPMRIC